LFGWGLLFLDGRGAMGLHDMPVFNICKKVFSAAKVIAFMVQPVMLFSDNTDM
jgi:hypothetical protein